METNKPPGLTDRIIDGLKKTITELEEFQVQTALGKKEAYTKYEEIKKKFKKEMQIVKEDLKETKFNSDVLKSKFEELELQLALGKAETLKEFMKQKNNILKSIHELEETLKANPAGKEVYATIISELEKFKIKLEILKLKFEFSSANLKDDFKLKKLNFSKILNEIKEKLSKKESVSEKEEVKMDKFSSEMSEAYKHLIKAFSIN